MVRSVPTVAYKPRPGEIPTNPGVYRFRDRDGRVLYVGKAKNLRARLSNYFAPLHTLHERTRRMVTTAASVEWTVVATDVDSLQLEYQWIKEFDPPFNVRYRDDKSYPFMAITLADEAPRVIVTRNRRLLAWPRLAEAASPIAERPDLPLFTDAHHNLLRILKSQ